MSGKNRTIPLTQKEEIEVQTEVNLINHNDLQENPRDSLAKNVRFSQIVTENILLKSFSNSQVFYQLSHLIDDLKKQGNGSETIQKRISLIEKQIQGLMKRDLLVNQKQQINGAVSDYYSIINQKEKQLLTMQYKLSHNGIKVQRYQRKIQQLQKEISSLRQSLQFTKLAISQNKIYKDFVNSLKEDKRIEARRFTEIQSQLRKLSTVSSKDSKINQTVQDEMAADLSGYFLNQIQKLQKEGKLSQTSLNTAIYSFYDINNQFNAQVSNNFQYQSKYQSLVSKYQHLISIFKNEVQQLSSTNPQIKGLKSLQNLIALTNSNERETEFINVAGWIGIGKLSNSFAYDSSSETSIQQKKLLQTFARQLKLLIDKYPKISTQISQQLRALFAQSQFLHEIIEVESFDRLKEIIQYQPEIIRVENVYEYNNKKQKNLIFNLRVLLKSVFEQLQRIRKKHEIQLTLDGGILKMMEGQFIEGIDVNQIIALYRPLPKIIEVQKIVEKPVYINGTLQKGIAIRTQRPILAQALTQKAVQVIREVPIYIQKVINNPIKQYVQVSFQNQKLVEVPTIRQVIAEKVMVNQKLNDIQVEKIVPLYEQKIVEVHNQKQVVVEKHKIVEIQKPVQLQGQKQFVEIEKIVQKPVYIRQTKQKIKQIEVINEKIFERDRYLEIQRKVPYVITNRQTVYLDREVPRFITNTEEKEVNVTQIIQKIVPYKISQEKVIEIPVVQEKEIVREVEKEVLVEMTHFIKGDRQEIIKQVEVIVEKPFREEYLITKQIEVEKVVPLYYKQEKPVYVEMQTPYIQSEPRIINQEIAKIVSVKEQIIKQVRIEVPVPVIVQKEVIRVQTVFIDRIIQKIVEVPRVIQVERIVEKIVLVPRIIQKIVEVPRIIERVVTVQVPCLQIVEVIRQIPVIRQVQIIKQVIIEKPIIQFVKQIQIVEKDKTVELVIERQVPKQIEVQRRIPIQVIRQVPVEVFRDRIVEKIIEIHEVTVKDREVVVPFKQQIPVQFIVQKPVITQKIIQTILKVPQIIQREKAITNTITIPEIHEVHIEKPIEIEIPVNIPGEDIIKYIEVPKEIEVLRQKVVQVQTTIEVPKQVYLYMDKIVHEYHERLLPVHVPKIIQQPYIVQVSKPQHYIHYKQIPVQVQTNRNVPIRTIIDQIKQVPKQIHHQKQIQIYRQRLKQIIQEHRQYIQRQVEKQILRQVVVNETRIQSIEIPAQTKIIQTMNTTIQSRDNHSYIEKVVERIVMLPQIVEVVKHIYEISQVHDPGVAVNVSVQDHTKQFTSVSLQLKASLVQVLQKFKANASRQPDLKTIIPIIETHLKQVQKWISFPKIVQIQRPVEKVVETQKIVLVPTTDHHKQSSLSYLVQKLVTQLRRIKDRNRIDLQLDEDIMKLFFKDNRVGISQAKFEQFEKELKTKYSSLGQWTQTYPFMINSFLQDYFKLNSTIEQVNSSNKNLQQKIGTLQDQLKRNENEIVYLNSHNAQLIRNYGSLLDTLRSKKQLSEGQVSQIIQRFALSKSQLLKLDKLMSEPKQQRQSVQGPRTSSVTDYKIDQNAESSNKQLSNLITKASKLQQENQNFRNKVKNYEKQVKILQNQLQRLRAQVRNQQTQSRMSSDSRQSQTPSSASNLKAIEQIKTRLVAEGEQKTKRLQQTQQQQIQRLKSSQEKQIEKLKQNQQKEIERLKQQKSQSSNNQLVNQNRKVSEQLRNLKRQFQSTQRSTDLLKQQHARQLENLKKQYQINLQKKDSNISSIQSVKARISEDYERKIKQLKQVHEKELERFKAFNVNKKQQQSKQDYTKKQQNEREVNDLRDKIKKLQIQLETSKKQVDLFQQQKSKMMSTAYTPSIFTSGAKQISELEQNREQQQPRERQQYSPQSKYSKIETYQSAIERKYVSPSSSVKSKDDDASSRKSSSSRRSEKSSKYKPQMTLKQFMELEDNEDRDLCSTFIMIKIIEKIEEQAGHGLLHSFSPSNIYLSNLNPKNLEGLQIKFGAPIVNKNNKNDGLYLAPEILTGKATTQKSIVFTLAVIWDELIHGSVYFKSMKDIESPQFEFKVRDGKLNPILKNTLFEMMNKDPSKRLQLHETKRRLSLQKYIASQSKK